MPFDSSGTFTRVRGRDSWKGDAAAATPIKADLHDINDNDIADSLSQVITKNGVTQPTADIPLNGHKLVNVGQPVNPQDAATMRYVQELSGWPTAKSISGADADGRLNFTSLTGVNGITWSSIGACWVARKADVSGQKERNRVVLNNNVDPAVGQDVVGIDEADGSMQWLTQTEMRQNLVFDGTSYRTPAIGSGGLWRKTANALTLLSNFAATTLAYGVATLETWFSLTRSSGSVTMALNKQASGQAATIQGQMGGVLRWQMQLGNGTAEDGTFAGSDYVLSSYNNSGALIGNAIVANRKTGKVSFPSGVTGVTDFESAVTATNINNAGGPLLLGGTAGVYVRPGGTGTLVGQTSFSGNGDVAIGRYLSAGGWLERQGTSGPDGGQYFNSWYVDSANIWAYVGTTHVGNWTPASDHRIKKEIAPLTSTWEAVRKLRPVKYTDKAYGEVFRDSDITRWGFLAHELQAALLPSAASGELDGEELQVPNVMTVVSALACALQEAQIRIEALEARLAA